MYASIPLLSTQYEPSRSMLLAGLGAEILRGAVAIISSPQYPLNERRLELEWLHADTWEEDSISAQAAEEMCGRDDILWKLRKKFPLDYLPEEAETPPAPVRDVLWSKEDEERLVYLRDVERRGWPVIAEILSRTIPAVRQHYVRLQTINWTEDDYRALEIMKVDSSRAVVRALHKRTKKPVMEIIRMAHSLGYPVPEMPKIPWTREELAMIQGITRQEARELAPKLQRPVGAVMAKWNYIKYGV